MATTYFYRRRPGLGGFLAALTGLRTAEYSPRRSETLLRARAWEATLRARWLSDFSVGLELVDWGPDHAEELGGSRYSIHLKLPGASLYVGLPTWFLASRQPREAFGGIEHWGARLEALDTEFPSELVLSWAGDRSLRVAMPWAEKTYRVSRLLLSGAWYHDYERDRLGVYRRRQARWNRIRARLGLPALPDPRADETPASVRAVEDALVDYAETHDYCYVLESGEAQDRRAEVRVREYESRRSWLRWCRPLARVRRSLDVRFSGAVGEGVSTWKGGCIGCSYEMLPGELPVHALRRMERDRKFMR